MAELSIKDGMKAYVDDVEREMEEGWGKRLNDDENQKFRHSLVAFADEEGAFMENAWGPQNRDQNRLGHHIRELVDHLVGKVKSRAMDAGRAHEIDEADLINRTKITIYDGPLSMPGSHILTGEIEEARPPESEDAAVEFTVATPDMDFQVSYPRQDFQDLEVDEDDIRGERELASGAYHEPIPSGPEFEDQIRGFQGMYEDEMDENDDGHFQPVSQQGDNLGLMDNSLDNMDAVGSAPLLPLQWYDHAQGEDVMESIEEDDIMEDDNDAKGKQPQQAKAKAPSEHPRHKNNNLWDVVVDAEKPEGQPTGYICKFARCNGWQGKWTSRKAHFEVKHPEEWFAFSGKRAKVHTCQVDGCGWSTTHGNHYMKKHNKDKHGLSEE
ncbi:hypothetical protein KVR01_009225 [Diaporthe batatas]|uniref:uncharacterized protein n=1 Tax=Diaporthe batatas TaxID=748121 RepID=UPI001D03DB5E|nr:uncharacterized protein KVR01_009225 [Diaporthe batatas]KAG8160961.1 hypothetical protein KVR01_009225 [Diaporthe batatas]